MEVAMETKTNPDHILHENGLMYREIKFEGLTKPLKLFISIKPQRLDGETFTEYKIRRKLINANDKGKYKTNKSR